MYMVYVYGILCTYILSYLCLVILLVELLKLRQEICKYCNSLVQNSKTSIAH